jgi:hypothetical protein
MVVLEQFGNHQFGVIFQMNGLLQVSTFKNGTFKPAISKIKAEGSFHKSSICGYEAQK